MARTEAETPGWTVASAKARLSEVMERAQTAPQTITRNGRPSVVMVSVDTWERTTSRKGSLARFLLESPLAGADVETDRGTDSGRDLDL